jgi:uncharacterized protein (TIGR00255 family)
MIQSMTGYGTGLARNNETSVAVEIRTVNHRFLDTHIRVPRDHAYLEPEIQQVIRGVLSRGRVDVAVTVEATTSPDVLVNSNTVRTYVEAAARLRDKFNFADALDLRTLLLLPGVMQNRETGVVGQPADPAIMEAVLEAVRQALDGVLKMRRQEGEALCGDMLCHLDNIRGWAGEIQSLASGSVQDYRRKLEDRLSQLLPQNGVDPQRLAQEVALLAERSDISEEIARLQSHIEQYQGMLASGAQAGKKLDFLLQEMQREGNTILSKASSLEITRLGIAIKSDIEKLREQVQNVE